MVTEDESGPAYGIGLSPSAARRDCARWGFNGAAGVVVEITKASYEAILGGSPEAVEMVDLNESSSQRWQGLRESGNTWRKFFRVDLEGVGEEE